MQIKGALWEYSHTLFCKRGKAGTGAGLTGRAGFWLSGQPGERGQVAERRCCTGRPGFCWLLQKVAR